MKMDGRERENWTKRREKQNREGVRMWTKRGK